jgi:aspartate racemase
MSEREENIWSPRGERLMKTIGLIGGMSWESSIEYYKIMNETVRAKLGGLHSAKCIMHSVDFAEMEPLQHQGKWNEATEILIAAARSVEAGGADFVILCTNTMHKVADEVQKHLRIPILHIADATAQTIKAAGLKRVGLLGTKFTMEEDFYKGRLVQKHNLEVIVPTAEAREVVHRVIYDELCIGETKPSSKRKYLDIMERLAKEGAEGIILGCTEIGLLIKKEDSRVPLFDTTEIHAIAAVEYALER